MSPWWLNFAVLLVVTLGVGVLGLGLLWRVAAWRIRPIESLTFDEGLRIGSAAQEIAAYSGDQERHLSFGGAFTLLVFGTKECQPCKDLLSAATWHPATRRMRLVYVGDSDEIDVPSEVGQLWEAYRLHNETKARNQWRAPVSPYFYVIDPNRRIAAKGVANKPAHLDRLLALLPAGLPATTLGIVPRHDATGGRSWES